MDIFQMFAIGFAGILAFAAIFFFYRGMKIMKSGGDEVSAKTLLAFSFLAIFIIFIILIIFIVGEYLL